MERILRSLLYLVVRRKWQWTLRGRVSVGYSGVIFYGASGESLLTLEEYGRALALWQLSEHERRQRGR